MSAPSRTGRTRKAAVAAAFGAAADGYEADAALQRTVAGRLADRIAALPLPPKPRVLEIGCGTGFLGRALAARLPGARWLATDLSEPMVARCRAGWPDGEAAAFLVMDGEVPCLAPYDQKGGRFDLICASLALQWFAEPGAALTAWAGLLAPDGLIAYATLAAGTFAEWRAAHEALGLSAGVPDYPEQDQLQALWPEAGRGRVETETVTAEHADAHAFLTVLKGIGAHLPAAGHRPLPPGALRRVLRRFAPPVSMTISYRVAYGLFRNIS